METLIAFLIIPAIAFNAPVKTLKLSSYLAEDGHTVYHYDTGELGNSIAYIEGLTWNRTDAGRTVIVGHNPGPFDGLDRLQIGDEIILLMDGIEEPLVYVVYQVGMINPDATWIFNSPTDEYELVLMTCYLNETKRLIVRAKLKRNFS